MKLGDIFGAGEVASVINNIIDRVAPNAEKAAEMKLKARELDLKEIEIEADLSKGQQEINKIEAANSSFFVAGWRPCVGWIGALALAYAAIIEPFMRFIAKIGFDYIGEFPVIDTTITMQLLFAILGVGGMRSFDKFKGTSK